MTEFQYYYYGSAFLAMFAWFGLCYLAMIYGFRFIDWWFKKND